MSARAEIMAPDEGGDGEMAHAGRRRYAAPRNVAEFAMLAGILREPEQVRAVRALVRPADLTDDGDVYRAMLSLDDRGIAIDPASLRAELTRACGYSEAEAAEAVGEFEDAVPTGAHAESHARLVVEEAQRGVLHRFLLAAIDRLERKGDLAQPVAQQLGEEVLRAIASLRSDAGARHELVSLADVLRDPELMKPPRAVVPFLVWEARSTLFAAREKGGKSTLAAFAAARLSRGDDFMGTACERGATVVFGLEQFLGDTARQLRDFGADPALVWLVKAASPGVAGRLAALRRYVEEKRPALAIVDSLLAWVRGEDLDANNATDMEPVLGALTELAHETGVGVLVLAHAVKGEGGGYAGSHAIGAAVDVIAEMSKPNEKDDPARRRVTVTGRIPGADFDYRLTDSGLELVADGRTPPASLRLRIRDYVGIAPGVSNRQVRESMGGRAKDIDDTLADMVRGGELIDRGDSRGHRYYVPDYPTTEGSSQRDDPGTTSRDDPLAGIDHTPRPNGTTPGRGADAVTGRPPGMAGVGPAAPLPVGEGRGTTLPHADGAS